MKENYDAYFFERTVSRYVKELREKFNLPKHADKRTYEAVPELPMGKQVSFRAANLPSCSKQEHITFKPIEVKSPVSGMQAFIWKDNNVRDYWKLHS